MYAEVIDKGIRQCIAFELGELRARHAVFLLEGRFDKRTFIISTARGCAQKMCALLASFHIKVDLSRLYRRESLQSHSKASGS